VVAWNGDVVRLWVGEGRYGGLLLTLALATYGCMASLLATTVQAVMALGGIREASLIVLIEAGVRLALQFLLVSSIGITGFPLAAVGAIGLVSLPMLMRAAARRFGGSAIDQARSMAHKLLPMMGLLALGAGIAAATASWKPSLSGLALGAAATAATLFPTALLLFPVVRPDLVRGLASWRAK
jgi:O-antigen/teichoic acid export membrane protein